MRIIAVTCVKNEGPFLLEWIAHNRVIGVTDHLFYSNGCDDGTDRLLDALARAGICTHLPNPARGRNYQMEALKHAARRAELRAADWVWIADVDEFPSIRAGAGTFADLIKACDSPQAISLSFQFFANGGVTAFEDRPVIAQFTRTHNPDLWCGTREIEVKTLVHRDFPLRYYGAHRPFAKRRLPDDLRWTDGSGRPVPGAFRHARSKQALRRFPASGARKWASLHHYALRARDSYLVKTDRGDVNRANRAFDLAYWQERNDGAHEDCSLLASLPRVTAEIDALKALPDVAALHDATVSAHRARIAALLQRPEYRALAGRLDHAPTFCPDEVALLASLAPPVLPDPEHPE